MTTITEAIQKLYVAYFSRPADVAGLAYWEQVAAAAGGDTAQVSAAFAASAEYKAAYSGMNAFQVVDTVYLNLFGRHAEAKGVQFWAPLLADGTLTVDVVVTAVASGAQGSDLVSYTSKVAAAAAFTAALDTSAEILGYSGALAIAKAIAFLAAITDAGQLAAATAPDALAASVSAITNTIGTVPIPVTPPVPTPIPVPVPLPVPLPIPAPTGQRIELGAGDNRLGDVTVAPGDVVDGGAGTDTLPLRLVTPLNMLAFYNFERLEVDGPKLLDMNGLNGNNRISEILVLGGDSEAGVHFENLGAGNAVRLAADRIGMILSTVAAIPVKFTVDIDEHAIPEWAMSSFLSVRGASALSLVFDADYAMQRIGQAGTDETMLNDTLLSVDTNSASSVRVVSGGDFSSNILVLSDASEAGVITELVISGDRPLTVSSSDLPVLALLDASASTGGVTVSTRWLPGDTVIRLGKGADHVAISTKSVLDLPRTIEGFQKTGAAGAPGDTLQFANMAVTVADTPGSGFSFGTVSNGVLTFTGIGPGSVGEAFAMASQCAETDGEALLFSFLDSTYLFVQGATDIAVKLAGLTGASGLLQGSDDLFLIA